MTDDFPTALGDVIDAVGDAAPLPRDRIDALLTIAAIAGSGPVAVAARRLAVIGVAVASGFYDPTSYDDAVEVMSLVTAALDVEITAAGDAGDDASFGALLALRQAVAADLTDRGASLAPLTTFRLPENLPALVVAQRLYKDAGRADGIVRIVDPVHPLFMPTMMQLLAS